MRNVKTPLTSFFLSSVLLHTKRIRGLTPKFLCNSHTEDGGTRNLSVRHLTTVQSDHVEGAGLLSSLSVLQLAQEISETVEFLLTFEADTRTTASNLCGGDAHTFLGVEVVERIGIAIGVNRSNLDVCNSVVP